MTDSRKKSDEKKELVDLISASLEYDDGIDRALDYALALDHPDKSQPRSIDVARRVLTLGTDRTTVIATLLTDPGLRGTLATEQVKAEFGSKVASLTEGVNQLYA